MPTVSFNGQNIECEDGDVILDILEKAGIKYPFGCLNGSCGVCAINVNDQQALHPKSLIEAGTLEAFEFEEETRLACRAKIKSDIKLTQHTDN